MGCKELIPFIAVLFGVGAQAQISKGGRPLSFGDPALAGRAAPEIILYMDDRAAEAEPSGRGDIRYGIQLFRNVDVIGQGIWNERPDGSEICLITISSPGARMLSVQFDEWELGERAEVFLYNSDRTFVIGGFDQSNRAPSGTMATQVVPGEAITIEYHVPVGSERGALKVSSITHAFIDLFEAGGDPDPERDIDPGYQSSPCHINVICPEAAAWQNQKRATLMFLRPDGNGCSGSLLNNTGTPGIPYVDIAEHCLVSSTLDQYVFYFNYDAPACVGSVGPTTQTMTGATYRASWSLDDLGLIELNQPIPLSYNVYYAGWDHSGVQPQTLTMIEHPFYDVKKIAFDQNPSGSYTDNSIEMWRVQLDMGMSEAGASGAPCYDQNKRFVGHMTSGSGNTCANILTQVNGAAKLSAMWDQEWPFYRMRDWLDPANTSMAIDGYDPNGAVPQVKVKLIAFLEGPYNTTNANMDGTLRTAGLVPSAEPYSGLGYTHVGGGGESTTQAVLNASGNTAVVDWVVIELRNKLNSTQVLRTRSALLLRNGNIVDTDGVSDVGFNMPADNYFVAVRHRNHLGIMTGAARSLSATATLLDLSNGSVALYNAASATKVLGGRNVLFAGDVLRDGALRYTGVSNDRDPILFSIGGTVATNTISGYRPEDVNMDGVVKYTGPGNDRDMILFNIGGSVSTATRTAALP